MEGTKMVTIIYNELTQYNIDVDDLTEDDIKDMDEEDIKDLVDSLVGRRDYDIDMMRENEHHRNEYEILNEDEESIKYFEESYD
jgi:predicted nucleotidyltransferase component of viral defense system